APLRCISISQTTFPFHFVPTVANWRDSQKTSGAKMPEAARLRPAQWVQARLPLRREAPPVAEDKALARDASHGQDAALTVRSAISAPTPFRKLHCCGQKRPNSLIKQNQSDTTAAGCVPFCRALPKTKANIASQSVTSLCRRGVRTVAEI